MKIENLTVQRFGEPAGGDFEIIVVELETDDGLRGMGYQLLFGTFGGLVSSLIREQLAPCVLNGDPWLTSTLWDRMQSAMPRRGGDGVVRGAIAARRSPSGLHGPYR